MSKSNSPILLAWTAALLLTLSSDAVIAAQAHPAAQLVERSLTGMRTDPEASRRDAQAALALLEGTPNADLQIRARLVLCDYQSERSAVAAEQEAQAAEGLLGAATRKGLRAGILTCRGETREAVGENDQAAALYEQAVEAATTTNDDEMLAGALYSRGNLRGLQGHYAAGLIDLERSQSLYEKIQLPQHSLTILNAIATLYNRMGDHAQAAHIYTRALKAQTEAGMRREQIVTLHNLGRVHENQANWTAAHEAFQKCLGISRELSYTRGEAYALRGLAAVAVAQGRASEALEILQRASDLLPRVPDARLSAQIELARGMALRASGKAGEAATALEKSLRIFEQTDALSELRANHVELAAAQAALGNGLAAYQHQVRAQQLSEQVLKNQLDQRFATLKIQFDTVTKEKENALLLRENAANAEALKQGAKVRKLQATVIALTAVLAALLATLVVRQRRNAARMRNLAMTDELTGVPNRRAALLRLAGLLRQGLAPCSVLVIDIDYFKSINDSYGHAEGDRALKLVAATLRRSVRDPAFVGRLGGEEFIAVLPATELQQAEQTAEHVRKQVMQMDTSRWLDRSITVSVGVANSAGDCETPSSLLQRADAALYTAKRSGRNCVKVAGAAEAEPQAAVAQA